MLITLQVPLRIGIHTGDVIFEGAEIYDDGINIAALLYKSLQTGKTYQLQLRR
ncbi:MAG: hypothetical protein ICV81_06360 [Flavisolibacter sp.]|nr:hypothetical protein [Flavisolibacter sp.]MBD0288858.1 hypothetical protein [Flavisolibacter sp.]MBD0352899.1 hypothetical protein [Flavisolibacter sp.]